MLFRSILKICTLFIPGLALATSVQVPMYSTSDLHTEIGYIQFTDSDLGLIITPHVTLSQGRYGMHIHVTPSCDDHGMAAGGHLDPDNTKIHKGPYDPAGHLGDLPILITDGSSEQNTSLAPRLNIEKILGHALMIHSGGDNYSDQPEPLGGGGARMFCGVIPNQAE